MKRFSILIAIALLAVACGRSKQIEAAGEVADTFFSAYCSGEYEKAAELCTEPVKTQILETPQLLSELDTSVLSSTMSIMNSLEWTKEVVPAEKEEKDITFIFSTTFDDQPLSYTVTLTPAEKVWRVSNII